MDHRARLGKAIDDMCDTKSCLDIFDCALKAKDNELERQDRKYKELLVLAMKFAETIKALTPIRFLGSSAHAFLNSPEVKAWKKEKP